MSGYLNPFGFAAAASSIGRYYRLLISNNNGGGITTYIYQWDLFTASNQRWPLVDMTQNNVPAPYVCSSSSGDFIWYAFNQSNTANAWNPNASLPQYVTINLGSEVDIDHISIISTGIWAPKDFQVFSSTTGAFSGEELERLSVTGSTGWGTKEERFFYFTA